MKNTMHAAATDDEQSGDEVAASRVGTLRGAQVADVNPVRLRTVAIAICALALLATAIFLFAAGARRNAQVTSLRDNGVRVTVTVTGCQGQLGGSGFNFVGYACTGTYSRAGHRYDVTIPGTGYRATGTTVSLVADPADPRLVSTVQAARHSQPSETVYILPAILLAIPVGLSAVLLLRRRRSWGRRPAPSPALTTH